MWWEDFGSDSKVSSQSADNSLKMIAYIVATSIEAEDIFLPNCSVWVKGLIQFMFLLVLVLLVLVECCGRAWNNKPSSKGRIPSILWPMNDLKLGEQKMICFLTLFHSLLQTGKIYAVIKSISFDKLLFFHGKKCSKVFATDWPTIAYQIFDGCGSDLGVD